MCGITGFLGEVESRDDALDSLDLMTRSLYHRGPDDVGYWIDPEFGIGFGHRRLSIIDVSPSGHQPMASRDGRYVLSFNGEIYNFRALRQELEDDGCRFRGRSDTEVMLEAFSAWGLDKTLSVLNGMFAFSLWDRDRAQLHLGRDRLGEKPLYYGWAGRSLLFGSELKALRAHRSFPAKIDLTALALFLRYGYVPAPHSIYTATYKLPPGTVATATTTRGRVEIVAIRPYWLPNNLLGDPFPGDEDEALDELDALLKDAVERRMVADVPVGAFLSGGIDSSLVVSLMQARASVPVKTFTVGFEETEFNEARHAKTVAARLGTDHTEMYVTPKEASSVIPRLPSIYDEPFADSSQIPTLLISELARRDVKVSLSGDGGDELFGGYARYFVTDNRSGRPARESRSLAAASLRRVSPRTWDALLGSVGPLLPPRLRRDPGRKIHEFARALEYRRARDYTGFPTRWRDGLPVRFRTTGLPTLDLDYVHPEMLPGSARQMMFHDTVTYLPDDLLVKVDRASMSVGLEARAPFLDHRVVEFAWSLPEEWKLKGGQAKWLPRRLLHRYLAPEFVERPKMGFDVPLAEWLRGPMREWAEDLLRVNDEGLLDPVPINRKWAEHRSGSRDWEWDLWNVLVLQAWLREQTSRSRPDRSPQRNRAR